MGYRLNPRKSVNVIFICFWWFYNEKFLPGLWVYFLVLPGHIPTQTLGKLPHLPSLLVRHMVLPKMIFSSIFKIWTVVFPQVWDCNHVFWFNIFEIYLSVDALGCEIEGCLSVTLICQHDDIVCQFLFVLSQFLFFLGGGGEFFHTMYTPWLQPWRHEPDTWLLHIDLHIGVYFHMAKLRAENDISDPFWTCLCLFISQPWSHAVKSRLKSGTYSSDLTFIHCTLTLIA